MMRSCRESVAVRDTCWPRSPGDVRGGHRYRVEPARAPVSIPKMQVSSLPEQLMLVALDPDRGRLSGAPMVYVAMAGGVVLDLLAGGVAVVQNGNVGITEYSRTTATALPSTLQHNALAAMATAEARDVKHWVRHFAAPKFHLGQQVAAALAERGLLTVERARRFGLVPVQRQRLLDGQVREELLATARGALASTAPPAPRAGKLLMLAETAGLLDRLANPPQPTAARQRIDQLTAQVPVAGAVDQAVAEVQAEVRAAIRRRRTAASIAAATGGTHGGE